MKTCPFCAEEIQDEAIKCRHCKEMQPEEPPVEPVATGESTGKKIHVAPGAKSSRRVALAIAILMGVSCSAIYLTTGFFVIQPLGAIPDGATVWYWRLGTSMPFIASADGILLEKQEGVSLLARGIALGALAQPIIDRKIVSLPYSKTLYLISTGGKEFDR